MAEFEGFGEAALEFYEGLGADNSKAYWSDHKATYDADVRAPLDALAEELGPEFGPGKVFRPYNDVRFHKGRPPYKEQAALVVGEAGSMHYLALSSAGLFLAGGYYQTATDQVQRMREAVADPKSGPPLVRAVSGLRATGWEVGGDTLQRVPKGFDPDSARADLLRHKTLTASRSEPPAEWLHTREALDRVRAAWRELAPLQRWLHTHVGPSRLPRG